MCVYLKQLFSRLSRTEQGSVERLVEGCRIVALVTLTATAL